MSRVVARIVWLVVAWIVLFGVYTLLVWPPPVAELVLGAVFSAVAVAAAEVAATAERVRFTFSPRWLSAFPATIGAAFVDTARLTALLIRCAIRRTAVRGEFHKVPLSRFLSPATRSSRNGRKASRLVGHR